MQSVKLLNRDRASLARYGKGLEIFTIVWAATEAGVALWSGLRTGSVSLSGFGWDSLIEVISALAVWWRLSQEMHHHRRHQAEKISLRISGTCLFALAAYVLADALWRLYRHESAGIGVAGIVITAAALVMMPLLSREKRRVGNALSSRAMMTDAKQTDFCMYQAGIVLLGLIAHKLFGITWADSAAALVLVPILARAAVLSFRGEHCCALH